VTVRPVLLFGASRGVGLELARLLRSADVPVAAMLRSPEAGSALERLGVRIGRGDAFSRSDVAEAFELLPSGGDVVSTLGSPATDGRLVDDEGNINVIDGAAASAGRVRRLVLVTAIGCAEMAPFRSARAIAAFGKVVDAKTRAEEHLRRVVPSATIVRPGGLRSEPPTGRGMLSTDPEIHGFVTRGDLARLIVRVLGDPATIGRAFAAVDMDTARTRHPLVAFPLRPLSGPYRAEDGAPSDGA
jgi:uncharacterized protein YbjT (DUF2867 family)